MTFEELEKLEPRLAALLAEARAVPSRGKPDFCANRAWYGNGRDGLKAKLGKLAGWNAEGADPRLHSEKAYDVAYQAIYEALPDCRHEGILC